MEAAGYTIDNHQLGEGAYGTVWKGKAKDGQLVAIKQMKKDVKRIAVKEYKKHRILSEADSEGFLIRMIAMIPEGNITNLIMEFADGGNLFDAAIKKKLSPSDVRFYFAQLINGVSFIHRKDIVHKDIKPDNLLLMSNRSLKIADFGMAAQFRKGGKELLLDDGSGTDQYSAPEIWYGEQMRGPPLDVWSAGVVLLQMSISSNNIWEAANSDDPVYCRWKSQTPLKIDRWRQMNRPIAEIVRMILEHNPEKRPTIEQIQHSSWFKANESINRSTDNVRNLQSSPTDEEICRKCMKHDNSGATVNWANCEDCEHWYHQSCAKISPLQDQIALFFCAACRRFWQPYHQEKMEAYIEKSFGGMTEKLILSEWIIGFKKETGFIFNEDTIRKYVASYLRKFVHNKSKDILKRIKYAFVGRIRCSIEAITAFKACGEVITSKDNEILAFFLNDSDIPLFSSDGHRKRKTRSRRGLMAATIPSPVHIQQVQSLSPTNQILANANDTIVDHNVKNITDATPGVLVGPPLDSGLLEIVIPGPSRANMPSSPASDPKPSLLTNKVALAESKRSPSERLEGSCSAKETTETVSSFSEKPQAPVRKDPVAIPEDEPIDQMPMNLVQVLETSEANTQRNEPNDGSQNDMEAQFDPSNQFPSDQMQHNGRLAAHMDLVNGDDIPFEEVLDVGNEQLQEFVNSPAAINHDATHGGEPTLSGDVEQDDGQSPEKRRRVYSFRTQDARMIRVGNFHMPSHPAALPGLQKRNRKEIPNPFVRHQNQMIIKTEEVEAPSMTLVMPGLPANIFLYVVHNELSKLNDSNKLFKSFMVNMGLLLNRNSNRLSSIIINEKELNHIFRGIITSEFLNPPEEDDDITADSDWKDKVALKKVFSSLYDMTLGIGPLSTSLQGIRDDINKKIEKLKENESVLLSLMDENFRFIFESRIRLLPIH